MRWRNLIWLLGLVAGLAVAQAPRLDVLLSNACPAPYSGELPGLCLAVERSHNLTNWQEMARVNGQLWPYPDFSTDGQPASYYRLRARPWSADTDDWSNQFHLASRALAAPPQFPGGAPFVKLTLDLAQPGRVYFQDSAKWAYHYHFIKARLPGCSDMTYLQFDQWALQPEGQRLAIGALLLPPDPQLREAALSFDGSVAFPVAGIAQWFAWTRARLVGAEGWRVYYFPSFEQWLVAQENKDFFQQLGIMVDSPSRWTSVNTSYSDGWALGRVVFVPGTNILAAFGAGQLTGADILVTERLPAEIPYVAGILVLEPATPNSHVALMARSFALPFAYVAGAALQDRARALDGQEVLCVVATGTNGVCTVTLTETAGRLTEERRQEILALKRPPALAFPAREARGEIALNCDTLTPADARFVGGKSAWYSLLRQAVPDRSLPAIAFTFDLWDDYMRQPMYDGRTLGETIAAILQSHQAYPPDVARLRADLATVRTLITEVADFNAAQRAPVLAALAGFATNRNVRFRSSANVEDGETYSGAGLYDSFSGCLGDDLDGDTRGPSCCNPTETNERGVFRALRKVFASFYNENAYVERRRLGVVETNTGMAVLAHYSFPDADELANGVAVWEAAFTNQSWQVTVSLGTQAGAASVTNPADGQQAEVVRAVYAGGVTNAILMLRQASSLTTNGAPVLGWETEYRELLTCMQAVADAYQTATGPRAQIALDFEYKKDRVAGLVLKQVRPLPKPPVVPAPEL